MTKSRSNSIADVVGLDQQQAHNLSIADGTELRHLAHDAAAATESERHMTLKEGIRLYPYAVGWSVLLSSCVIMEGFDNALIASLFALTPFVERYGTLQADGTYTLSASWESALTNGAVVGEILGLAANGIIAERYGYRKTILASLVMMVAFVFLPFFARGLPQLLAGEILIGIPFGVFQTITTTYASEVCPVALRAYLTTYVNLCWVIGQLIASGVLRGFADNNTQWAYRVPFALQWMWPVPIAIGVMLAPESPWWLIRKERREDAKAALIRLTKADPDLNIDDTIAMMEHTNLVEKSNNAGTSYLDCFKNSDLRRTEIVVMVWVVQTLCGSTFMGYSSYFFEAAGMSETDAFTLSLALYALGALGTMSSWFFMTKFGRRTLYVWGQIFMCLILFVIGFLGLISTSNTSAQWAVGSLLLLYTFTYDATIGPVCYSLVSELSSSRLRAKTVVLARIAYNVAGLATNVLTPDMLDSTAWNWGAKSAWFWSGTCALCLLWTFFRLPEPKGRTYGELDILFEQKVPARKFRSTAVDQFGAAAGSDEFLVCEEKKAGVDRVEKV